MTVAISTDLGIALDLECVAIDCDHATDPMAEISDAIRADLNAGSVAVDAAMPPHWLCRPILPIAGASLAGPGGVGKTALVLNEMVRVATGGTLYGCGVESSRPCVLITAEDGANYARYQLKQVLLDGIESGQLSERAASRAKQDIRIIGWQRARYGPIVEVGTHGDMHRAPVFDVLLNILSSVRPGYVTLDPSILFGAGERYWNDGDAFLASMLHETALAIDACIQAVDHVSQTVARTRTVDQYAARGGTAKTDNARLARQLLRVDKKMAGETTLPPNVDPQEIKAGNILQLHTTKSNYAALPPMASLRRRGYWLEYLRTPSADEIAAIKLRRQSDRVPMDATVVVEYVRQNLGTGSGIRQSRRDVEIAELYRANGNRLSRDAVRAAVQFGVATGMLRYLNLPQGERRGQRKQYLAPTEHLPSTAEGVV